MLTGSGGDGVRRTTRVGKDGNILHEVETKKNKRRGEEKRQMRET